MNRPIKHIAGTPIDRSPSVPPVAPVGSPVTGVTVPIDAPAHSPAFCPTGGAGASNASTYTSGTGPHCERCSRNVSMCLCDSPEPEAEYFKPGCNYDPDAGWAFAERSAFGMSDGHEVQL